MRFRFFYLVAAVLLAVIASPQSASAAYVLTNTNNGDGYVVTTATGYTIYGSNNGLGSWNGTSCSSADSCYNYTTYTNVATHDAELVFSYSYVSNDTWGSAYDPAGFVINGVYTQLTPNDTSLYDWGVVYSGVATLSVLAGQTYGFYVESIDSTCGPGVITVSYAPLPAALPLFAASLLGFGAIARKKRA